MKKLLKYSKMKKLPSIVRVFPVLGRTESVCPVCLSVIPARYISLNEKVLLSKTCPEHGFFKVPVWEGAESFRAWRNSVNSGQPPINPARETGRGCPYDCGLCENHIQATCCVLLEVTERCDLNCPVCYASAGGITGVTPPLSEIAEWYDMLLRHGGPFNIQLSGGEPSLRDDLPEIISIGREKGFRFFQLNTNGLRIAHEPEYLHSLAQAGLSTVFLQFDTLDSAHCAALRGRDIIAEKLLAVDNCSAEGLGVVLVPTVRRSLNDGDLGSILDYASKHMPTVRGVHFQPMSFFGRYDGKTDDRLTIPALLRLIEKQTCGRIKASDMLPGGAEHPMCSFHADYTVSGDTWRLQNSSGGCCCSTGSSDISRRVVARKWSAPKTPAQPVAATDSGDAPVSLDRFLFERTQHTLAISGMAFQDAWNLDLERLSRCYINVVSKNNELIPFCAYNLTSVEGRSLYRK